MQDLAKEPSLPEVWSIKYQISLKISFDADYYAPYKTMNAFVRNSGVLTIKSLKDLTSIHDRSFTSNDIGCLKKCIQYYG